MVNPDAYPLKFSEKLIENSDGPILEAGCANKVFSKLVLQYIYAYCTKKQFRLLIN